MDSRVAFWTTRTPSLEGAPGHRTDRVVGAGRRRVGRRPRVAGSHRAHPRRRPRPSAGRPRPAAAGELAGHGTVLASHPTGANHTTLKPRRVRPTSRKGPRSRRPCSCRTPPTTPPVRAVRSDRPAVDPGQPGKEIDHSRRRSSYSEFDPRSSPWTTWGFARFHTSSSSPRLAAARSSMSRRSFSCTGNTCHRPWPPRLGAQICHAPRSYAGPGPQRWQQSHHGLAVRAAHLVSHRRHTDPAVRLR